MRDLNKYFWDDFEVNPRPNNSNSHFSESWRLDWGARRSISESQRLSWRFSTFHGTQRLVPSCVSFFTFFLFELALGVNMKVLDKCVRFKIVLV